MGIEKMHSSSIELWEHLSSAALYMPDDIAIVSHHSEAEITYQDLWKRVVACGNFLSQAKARKILALLPNHENTLILFLACLTSGLDICILASNSSQGEIQRAIKSCRPDLVITAGTLSVEHIETDYRIRSARIEELVDTNERFLESAPNGTMNFSYGNLIVATSGTTGAPKFLVHSGRNLWNCAEAFSKFYGLTKTNVFWNFLPMSYLGGTLNLCLIPLASRGRILVDKELGGHTFLRFSQTINRFGINSIWLIPTLVRALMRIYGADGKAKLEVSQSLAFIGTSPSTVEERVWAESLLGCQVYENYGLSETTFLLAEPRRSPLRRRRGMIRFPDVRIIETGGPNTMKVISPHQHLGSFGEEGTFNQIDTKKPFDTSDFVAREYGRYKVVGRNRDRIKKGGTLINLLEIERLVRRHVDWGEVAIIVVDDGFYGENYIVLFEQQGAKDQENALIGFLARELSPVRMPADVRGVADIPLTKSGKVDKLAAKAMYFSLAQRER